MKVTTYLHPVPRSRMVKLYLHLPITLHGVVFNSLGTGIILPYIMEYTLSNLVIPTFFLFGGVGLNPH
jgi:hypothetical protein